MYNANPRYDDYGDEIGYGGENCGMWVVGPFVAGGVGEDKKESYKLAEQVALVSVAPDWKVGLERMKYDLGDDITNLRTGGDYSMEVNDVIQMLETYHDNVIAMLEQGFSLAVKLKREVRGTHEWGSDEEERTKS